MSNQTIWIPMKYLVCGETGTESQVRTVKISKDMLMSGETGHGKR